MKAPPIAITYWKLPVSQSCDITFIYLIVVCVHIHVIWKPQTLCIYDFGTKSCPI